jgi:hypothetical protein
MSDEAARGNARIPVHYHQCDAFEGEASAEEQPDTRPQRTATGMTIATMAAMPTPIGPRVEG